jgi:hypothetical protein
MPEGLSDQDRARIESARQNASGGLSLAGFVGLGFAVSIALLGIVAVITMGASTDVMLIMAILAAPFCLFGLGYFWISRQ